MTWLGGFDFFLVSQDWFLPIGWFVSSWLGLVRIEVCLDVRQLGLVWINWLVQLSGLFWVVLIHSASVRPMRLQS